MGVSKFTKKRLKMVLELLFEVIVNDVISKYEIPFYEKWDNIDVIFLQEVYLDIFIKIFQ